MRSESNGVRQIDPRPNVTASLESHANSSLNNLRDHTPWQSVSCRASC